MPKAEIVVSIQLTIKNPRLGGTVFCTLLSEEEGEMFRSITRPMALHNLLARPVCVPFVAFVRTVHGAGQTASHPFSNTREPHRSRVQTPPDLPCCAR